MRMIHTADWHLGQQLHGRSRHEEQAIALDWLLATIETQKAELLIVAGDVFDTGSPAEDVRRLYHDTLARLSRSCLKWVVIVAGNHDSPRMIANVRELARGLGIYVVSQPSPAESCHEDLIELRNPNCGTLEGIVAGIPFLHDRHVRQSRAGSTAEERATELADGILAHFRRLADGCASHAGCIPVIATGHLYATGAVAREGQDNIYVGNIRNLSAAELPTAFDYVALGHIHRPQALPGAEHVRYSGSLIALDFQECVDEKGVWCVDLDAGLHASPVWIACEAPRRLKRLEGSCDEVCTALAAFGQRHTEDLLRPWVELALTEGYGDHASVKRIRELAEGLRVDIVKIQRQRPAADSDQDGKSKGLLAEPERLEDLSVFELFNRRCALSGVTTDSRAQIELLFREVADEVLSVGEREPV